VHVVFTVFGIVVAIGIIVVGAVFVRRAKGSSGYLMIAAGAIELLTQCCLGFVSSDLLHEMDMASDETGMVFGWSMIAGVLARLTIGILLAISLVGLARAARRAKTEPAS